MKDVLRNLTKRKKVVLDPYAGMFAQQNIVCGHQSTANLLGGKWIGSVLMRRGLGW